MATTVHDAAELAAALAENARVIEVAGVITGSPMITLPPGTTLRGRTPGGATLKFLAKGVRLSRDNTVEDIIIEVPEHEAAILNDTTVADLGTLTLRNVTTFGQVVLLAEDAVRAGHVLAEGVHVAAADVRGRYHRPHGFGVDALQGAFTLWNRQPDTAVKLTAELLDLSAGSKDAPVRGSGVFVGGHGDFQGAADGGTIAVTELRTGEIHADGGIPVGTPDLISGGVFVITGAVVAQVTSAGPVTTYGPNDMVLDNWGEVATWTATAPVTSHGPSGIGFVNFGEIGTLDIQAPIVTTGKGARGFNLYDGSLDEARFESIATTGDGSIGIQVAKPLRRLVVAGDVTTSGGEGMSLVRGVQVSLRAIALSVKAGGVVDSLEVGGRLATSGEKVATLEVAGTVGQVSIAGGVAAAGEGSDALWLSPSSSFDATALELTAEHGEKVRVIEG